MKTIFDLNNKNVLIITSIIGSIFLLLNIFTITWGTLPWVDEVMTSDAPINFALEGKWYTTAVHSAGGIYPPTTLGMPLYQFLLIPWVKLFGVSPLAIRSLNLLLTFIISYLLIKTLFDIKFLKSKWTLILFLIAFWGAATFIFIYRSGRVDILNLLTVTFFCRIYYLHINNRIRIIWLYASAILIPLSGIQAGPFVLLLLLWIIIFKKDYRKTAVEALKIFIIACIFALLFASLFFYSIHGLIPFLISNFSYSSTLRKIAIYLLPYVGGFFHLDVDKILLRASLSETVNVSFVTLFLKNITQNVEFIILTLFNLSSIIYLSITKKNILYGNALNLLGFSVAVPLFMSIAGRFQLYYTWMAYIPALICTVYIVDMYKSKLISISYAVIVIIIFSFGFPKTILSADRDTYSNMSTFMKKQKIDPEKDIIVSNFFTYYLVRNITREVYFLGIYPIERTPDDANIVIYAPGDFGEDKILSYLMQCKNNGRSVNLTDSLVSPKLYFYRIGGGIKKVR